MKYKTEKEYKKLFDEAYSFDSSRFNDYRELAAFYEGEQHKLTQYKHERPWVVSVNAPYATYAIDERVASLQSNDYVGEIEPLSPEDVESVRILNNIVHNLWDEIQLDNFIDEAIENCAVIRESYIHIVYDPDKQKGGTNTIRQGVLSPYFINPASILIDPKTRDFREAEYIIVVERISKKKAIETYFKGKEEEDIQSGAFSSEERGEVFEGNEYNAHQEDVLTKWTVYEKENEKVYKTVLVENKIVEKTKEFPIDIIPIAQLRWKRKINSPYGLSLMDMLIGLQKSVNSIESATTNAALQYAVPSYAINKASGINPEKFAEVVGAPGVVISVVGDASRAVSPLIPKQIEPSMLEYKRENELSIYNLAGVSDQFKGVFGTAGNTKSGSENSLMRAKNIERKFLTNLETFIEDLTKIIVKFVQNVFIKKTFYSRGEKKSDGSYDFESTYIPEQIKDINYSFSINMNVKTPYAKEKTRQLIQELFQIESQYDTDVKTINILDIIETYDIPNKEELVERYKRLISQDNEEKSQVILEFVALCTKHGIDQNIISQGIMELIEGKEMTTVEEITNQIEQKILQEEQERQLITGNEEFTMNPEGEQPVQEGQTVQEEQELTGDEEFTNEEFTNE